MLCGLQGTCWNKRPHRLDAKKELSLLQSFPLRALPNTYRRGFLSSMPCPCSLLSSLSVLLFYSLSSYVLYVNWNFFLSSFTHSSLTLSNIFRCKAFLLKFLIKAKNSCWTISSFLKGNLKGQLPKSVHPWRGLWEIQRWELSKEMYFTPAQVMM